MAENNCISQLKVDNILYDIKDTKVRDILSGGFFEQTVYEDIFFKDVVVPEGKILTFMGYSTGKVGGDIVTRYKSSSGVFGIVGPDLSFEYDAENEMISINSEDDGAIVLNITDDDNSMTVNGGTLVIS